MSEDTVTNEGRKISVSFSRKLSDGNYGTTEASAWVQGDATSEATPGEISVLLGDLFAAAAVAVLDQLGVAYEIGEDGCVRETHQPAVQTAQSIVEKAFGPTTNVAHSNDIRVMNPNDQQGPLPDWLVRACQKEGITAVWDNRSKATGKQPHFKEAVPKDGTGHGKDGEPKAFWPPR